MNHQNTIRPDGANEAAKPAENGDAEKSSQISLPQNEESRGPFEHSGETSRQTEEQQAEEQDEKSEQA